MVRFAALLVAASVLAAGLPAAADGIPIEKRPTVTKKKKRIVRKRVVIEKKVVVDEAAAPPPVIVAPPPPPSPPAVWMPGGWTWSAPMSTHIWVPGMYVWPPPTADEQSLAQWRTGKWLGFGRED